MGEDLSGKRPLSGPVVGAEYMRHQRVSFSVVGSRPSATLGWETVDAPFAEIGAAGGITQGMKAFCPAVVDRGRRDPAEAGYADFVALEVSSGIGPDVLAERLRRMGLFGLVMPAAKQSLSTTVLSLNEVPVRADAVDPLESFRIALATKRGINAEVAGIEVLEFSSEVVVHHQSIPVSLLILPMPRHYKFYSCCLRGRFEALADWHEMVTQLAATIGVPLMPGDTSPTRAFALADSNTMGGDGEVRDPLVVGGSLLHPGDWCEAMSTGEHSESEQVMQ